MTYTHTFVHLEVSQATYDEVRQALEAAGYQHAFLERRDGEVIDMHGLALKVAAEEEQTASYPVRSFALAQLLARLPDGHPHWHIVRTLKALEDCCVEDLPDSAFQDRAEPLVEQLTADLEDLLGESDGDQLETRWRWVWNPLHWRLWCWSGEDQDPRCLEEDERVVQVGPLIVERRVT